MDAFVKVSHQLLFPTTNI